MKPYSLPTCVLRSFLSLVLILTSLWTSEVIADNRNVVIINSNSNIPKYQRPQQAFEKEQSYHVNTINLADKQLNTKQIKYSLQQSDIIYAIGANAYQLVTEMTVDKPMVFSTAINWKRLPERANTYGVSNELPAGRQLMMYRYLFPDLKKIGIIYSPQMNKEWLEEAIDTSKDVGIEIISEAIEESDELEPILESLLGKVDALWLISDSAIASKNTILKIFNTSKKMQKPVFAYHEVFVGLGALLVISADIPTISQQVISLMDDILKNKTIDKAVVFPAGSHVILNMKALKQSPLRLNETALDSVNKIVE